jgi:DNA-binding XRE family transcriptional regulator
MQHTQTPLVRLRRSRTLNQQQLAELVGISQQTLSKIERGQIRPDVGVQARLAAILGAAVEHVFPADTVTR